MSTIKLFCFASQIHKLFFSNLPQIRIRIGYGQSVPGGMSESPSFRLAPIHGLNSIRCECQISVKLKRKVYKSAVIPALLYGAETWATMRGQEALSYVYTIIIINILSAQ